MSESLYKLAKTAIYVWLDRLKKRCENTFITKFPLRKILILLKTLTLREIKLHILFQLAQNNEMCNTPLNP